MALATLPSREMTAEAFDDWGEGEDDYGRYLAFGDIIEWYIEGKLVAPVPGTADDLSEDLL